MNGLVKSFNISKGFGFISGEDGKNYFFHISDVKSAKELKEEHIVEFKFYKHVKGLRAEEIYLKSSFTKQDYAKIGSCLSNIRQKKQVSPKSLSELSNVAQNEISDLEKGEFSHLFLDYNAINSNLKSIIKALNISYIDLLTQADLLTKVDLNNIENLGKSNSITPENLNYVEKLIQSNFITKEDIENHIQFRAKKIELTTRLVSKIYYPDGIDKIIFETSSKARAYLGKKGYVRHTKDKYCKTIEGPFGPEFVYSSCAEILRFNEPV